MLTHGYAADLCGHVFGGVPDTPPSQVYVGLLRSWTTNEVTEDTADELTVGGYSRQPVTMSDQVINGRGSNATTVTWTLTEDFIALAVGLYDSASGGRMIGWQPLRVPIGAGSAGDTITFDPGTLRVNMKARLRGEFDWSTVPEIWGYWWAGQFGENCDMIQTSGHDDQECTRVYDQSGRGNHLDGFRPEAEYPMIRFGFQIASGSKGGFYSTPFASIGSNSGVFSTHYSNIYTLDSPLSLDEDFYLICAFVNTRTGGDRIMWGATDSNDYVNLNQLGDSMTIVMSGVSRTLATEGQVPDGLCIVEIFRDQSNTLSCRINGNLISSQSAAGAFNLTGWGHDSNIGNDKQWDDYLCALAVCDGLPTARNQALMYQDLREIWEFGRRDWPRCGWTDYGADLLYRHVFLGETFPVPAGGYYAALCHMRPGDAANGGAMNELLESGYQRPALTFDADTRARGLRSNDATLNFGTAGDRWTRVPAHWAITDTAGVGTGRAYFWGGCLAPSYVKNGQQIRMYAGDLTVNMSHH